MIKKQKINEAFTVGEASGNRQVISLYKKSIWIYVAASTLLLLLLTTVLFAEEDPIYKKCMAQKDDPGPWCYMEEVKKKGDPSLCENILKYWPKATGVHGQCYYEAAIKKKECELCKKIMEKDIKKMCELDACK